MRLRQLSGHLSYFMVTRLVSTIATFSIFASLKASLHHDVQNYVAILSLLSVAGIGIALLKDFPFLVTAEKSLSSPLKSWVKILPLTIVFSGWIGVLAAEMSGSHPVGILFFCVMALNTMQPDYFRAKTGLRAITPALTSVGTVSASVLIIFFEGSFSILLIWVSVQWIPVALYNAIYIASKGLREAITVLESTITDALAQGKFSIPYALKNEIIVSALLSQPMLLKFIMAPDQRALYLEAIRIFSSSQFILPLLMYLYARGSLLASFLNSKNKNIIFFIIHIGSASLVVLFWVFALSDFFSLHVTAATIMGCLILVIALGIYVCTMKYGETAIIPSDDRVAPVILTCTLVCIAIMGYALGGLTVIAITLLQLLGISSASIATYLLRKKK